MALPDLMNDVIQFKIELDRLRPINREQEARIMQKFRLDWNFHSNHLEGNSLTYGETKALILFGITAQGKPLKDHIEITGHDEAIKWLEDVVKEQRPLTENFIRELNELILKEPYRRPAQTPDGQPTTKLVTPGQYKTQPNHVQTVTGEMFYFASPEETPAQMHDLMEWFRAKKADPETYPVLLAAEFHYKFIRIHPFDDGNGRTARILMNFILMQSGYPPVVIKTDDKQNYIAALRQADAGILEPFVEYIASNLIRSLEIIIKGAKGENIDDPDDLDKEIALLEQKLKNASGIEIVRTNNIVTDIFENSLIKLIGLFLEKSRKFKKLYQGTKFSITLREQKHPGESEGDEYLGIGDGAITNLYEADFIKKILDKLKTPEKFFVDGMDQDTEDVITFEIEVLVEEIKIVGSFSKNISFEKFHYQSIITISFEPTAYYLSTQDNSVKLKKYYSEQLSDQEINKLIDTEIKQHFQTLEAKLKEIQNRK